MKKQLLIFGSLLLSLNAAAQFYSNATVISVAKPILKDDQFLNSFVADLDKDGILDLMLDGGMFLNQSSFGIENSAIEILKGDGYGGFDHVGYVDKGGGELKGMSDVGDYNKDGFMDLIVYSFWANGFTIYNGGPGMKFTPGVSFSSGTHGATAKFQDMDKDGDLDIVTISSGSAAIIALHVFTNTGGTFTQKSFPVAPDMLGAKDFYPFFSIGDVNGDGLMDVMTNNDGAAQFTFVQNTTNDFVIVTSIMKGNFTYPSNFRYYRSYDDINGDGKADFTFHKLDDSYLYTTFSLGSGKFYEYMDDKKSLVSGDSKFTNPKGRFYMESLDADKQKDLIFNFHHTPSGGGTANDTIVVVTDPYNLSGHRYETKLSIRSRSNNEFNRGLSFGDFNNDGRKDVLSIGSDNNIRVFMADSALATGISDVAMNGNSIKIFPNPTTGTFSIQIDEKLLGAQAKIYNMMGQKIRTLELNNNVTQQTLPTGVYIIEVVHHTERTNFKLIIN